MSVEGSWHVATGRTRLAAFATLLQRRRNEHPTAGTVEAADLQWWWRASRLTDEQPPPCWFDADGPVAAVTATQWREEVGLDVHVLPSPSDEEVAHVWAAAFDLVASEARVFAWCPDDGQLTASLPDQGCVLVEEVDVSGWMDAADEPSVPPLADGYRLQSRANRPDGAHPLVTGKVPTSRSASARPRFAGPTSTSWCSPSRTSAPARRRAGTTRSLGSASSNRCAPRRTTSVVASPVISSPTASAASSISGLSAAGSAGRPTTRLDVPIQTGLLPAVNAALLGYVLHRSGLVLRAIPTIGLIGAPLLAASVAATLFYITDQVSVVSTIAVLRRRPRVPTDRFTSVAPRTGR